MSDGAGINRGTGTPSGAETTVSTGAGGRVSDRSPELRRITFLGPVGTFTEAALRSMDSIAGFPATPATSVPTAFEAVRAGETDAALVPIENSVEGSVAVTLDELNTGEPLMIRDEIAVPVRFDLVAAGSVTLDQITVVGTHPHAAAQCRRWLAENLPGAGLEPTASTAGAAASLGEPGCRFNAAIVAPLAAEHYDVQVLAEDIGDNSDAWTRFVLVGRAGPPPERTGCDKTTLALFMRANRPGALLEILTELASRGVNLTRIESRPTRRTLGEYSFSVDLEGHLQDARVADALTGLKRICADVRYLGSYPSHSDSQSLLRDGVSDADYEQARAWLAGLY